MVSISTFRDMKDSLNTDEMIHGINNSMIQHKGLTTERNRSNPTTSASEQKTHMKTKKKLIAKNK